MYIKYDSLGKLTGWFDIAEYDVELQLNPGETSLFVDLTPPIMLGHYFILNGTLHLKETQLTSINKGTIIANGIDELIIQNAPIGATINITNITTGIVISGIADGADSFVTDDTGSYTIEVIQWPYLDFKGTFDAT
mgnify:CR=1 FL=1